MKILEVHNFQVKFRQQKDTYFDAVKNINFHINKGEILGLIGESGSGKSVASQCLTGLVSEAICTGEVLLTIEGDQLDLLSADNNQLQKTRREHISYIFQEPMTALNPLITCGKQILECASSPSPTVLKELLTKVELYETQRIANSFPHELSGGQRQRVMIAMALAKKPKLLIADEPTTALDIAVQREILSLLKKLSNEDQMAILFITHDLLSLNTFADRIAVMYHGEIVENGDPSSILKNSKHAYTKALVQSRATYAKKGTQLDEIDDLMKMKKGRLVFHINDPVALPEIIDSEEKILTLSRIEKTHYKNSLFKKIGTTVLSDISIDLCRGDSLGLIGESGSGKSTIAKLILRIWKQTQGNILLYDKPIENFRDLSNEIQLVFQDPFSSLNPKHTVGFAILEVLNSVHEKQPKEKALSLLQEVGLSASDYTKYPHEFSGGQRQRICIAKSLAKNPKIIVLDEAVSALDVSVQAKILNLLNDLKQRKGLTYLLISHDMNVVSYFCNKIVVLRQGSIIEIGKTENLIKHPASAYTKSLMEHSIN